MGYYNGHDESDGVDGWTTERIEATHCIDEKDFLNMKKDDISKWTKITGDFALIEGKRLIRQVDSKEMVLRHKEPYYTDTVYDEVYTNGLESISYVDGRIVSAETLKEKVRKYIKQLHEIMGKSENKKES